MEADAEKILANNADALMALANVQSVGLGEKAGRAVIMVFVDRKVPLSALPPGQIIPPELEGCEVVVEEIGTPTAL